MVFTDFTGQTHPFANEPDTSSANGIHVMGCHGQTTCEIPTIAVQIRAQAAPICRPTESFAMTITVVANS